MGNCRGKRVIRSGEVVKGKSQRFWGMGRSEEVQKVREMSVKE